jgi:hypothetical protein
VFPASEVAAPLADCGLVPPIARAACQLLRGDPAGVVSAVAGGAVDAAAETVFGGAVRFVADGAGWLLDQVGAALAVAARIDITAGWFTAHYRTMASLGALACAAFLLLSAAASLLHQDPRRLARHAASVATAGAGTGLVVAITGMALAVTDELCAAVSGGTHDDVAKVLHGFAKVLIALAAGGGGLTGAGAVTPAAGLGKAGKVPLFAVLLLALLVAVAALVIWLELLLRSAAVYAAVLFFPLALAALSWEATRRWAARLARSLAALILSKFVIVAILSAGASGLASGADGVSGVLAGAAMLLIAMFSPFLVFRLTGVFDDATGHAALDGARSRGLSHTVYAGSSMLRTAQSMRHHRAAGGAGGAGRAGMAGSASKAAPAGKAAAAGPAGPVALAGLGAYTAGRAAARAAGGAARVIRPESRRPPGGRA